MAINKKLLHFVSKANFSTQLANSNIDSKSIVFIKDTGEIWTHDKLYSCASWGTNQTNYVPLTIGGKSYDLSKDGHTHSYLPLSGGTLTGDLEIFASNTDKFIKFTYNTTDAYAWRIGYLGTGAGNENRLAFQSAKTSGASYIDALSFGLDDLVGRFAVTPTVGNTKVSLEGHTHSNFTRTVAGLVPAPGEATTTRYLREDGAWIVPPNTPDTHWTTGIRAGVSGTNTNSVANDPFIKVLDNTTYRSQIQILGGTNITATSDATGKITIDGTHNHDTVYVKKVGDTMSGSLTATSFVKANVANSQNYLLQADGGHILKSAFSGSGHTHPYLPLTGGTLSNSQSYLSGNSFSGILEIVNTSEGVSGEEIGPHISFKGLRGASDTGSYAVYGAIGAINTAPSGLSGGALVFLTKNANGGAQTPTEQMRIATGGNVGIGTTSPAYKLDVSGDVRATGTFRGSLIGNASSASAVLTSAENTGTTSRYILFANSASGNQALKTDSGLRYVPSTNTISANFAGDLTGLASLNLPLTGGTLSGALRWANQNGLSPYIGQYDTDGSFLISLGGQTTNSGLVLGGSSGNLLWKGNRLFDTSNMPTLTAGNGLSGGGVLNANRTLTLGTPSNITATSTNSVTATSHTHNLSMGSGSGLDADLLDGYHIASIPLKSDLFGDGISVLSGFTTKTGGSLYVADKYIGLSGYDGQPSVILVAPIKDAGTTSENWSGCIGRFIFERGSTGSGLIQGYADVGLAKAYYTSSGYVLSNLNCKVGYCVYNSQMYLAIYFFTGYSYFGISFSGRYSGNCVFNRVPYSSVTGWTDLGSPLNHNGVRLATIDSNVYSATKLAIARTIWGQSFDGTDNITGPFSYAQVRINNDNEINSTTNSSGLWLGYRDTKKVVIGNNNACFLEVKGKAVANQFVRSGSSDNYVLLGGGGHVLLSSLSSSHNHDSNYFPLTGGRITTGTGDVYVEFWRGTNASWKMLNSGGVLHFQSNYVSSVGAYYDAMTLSYNSGNVWVKGTLNAVGGLQVNGSNVWHANNFSVTLNGTSTTSANFYAPTKQLSVQSGTNSYLIGASSTTSLGTVYSNAGIYMNGNKLYTGSIQASGSISTSGSITASNLWGIASKNVSLTLTTNWQDTGILMNDSTLFSSGSGTYIIELSSDTPGVSSQWNMRYSGIMTVFTSTTNSTDTDEITLHSMGHASNGRQIYLRTVLQLTPNYAKIQIASSATSTGAGTITIKTRRII